MPMRKMLGGTIKKEIYLDVTEKNLKTTRNTKKENVSSAIQKEVIRDSGENFLKSTEL